MSSFYFQQNVKFCFKEFCAEGSFITKIKQPCAIESNEYYFQNYES